jgi:hypothetical protein
MTSEKISQLRRPARVRDTVSPAASSETPTRCRYTISQPFQPVNKRPATAILERGSALNHWRELKSEVRARAKVRNGPSSKIDYLGGVPSFVVCGKTELWRFRGGSGPRRHARQ